MFNQSIGLSSMLKLNEFMPKTPDFVASAVLPACAQKEHFFAGIGHIPHIARARASRSIVLHIGILRAHCIYT